jgi:CDP-4-dehydro-6-deoxyglucose reductase
MRNFSITLRPHGDELSCQEGETVLAALLRNGYRVFYGCAGGGCGVCKMLLASGLVEHGRCSKAVLTDDERSRGYFLSCKATPVADLEIEIREINRREKLEPVRKIRCDSLE